MVLHLWNYSMFIVFPKIIILTLSLMSIFRKSALFKAERHLAISNCPWFLLDGALELKLGVYVHWAIGFQKQAFEFKTLFSQKPGGVSKLHKIAIFFAFYTPKLISETYKLPNREVRVWGFSVCFAHYPRITLRQFPLYYHLNLPTFAEWKIIIYC